MSADREKIGREIELDEEITALDYAVRRGLPIERVFDRGGGTLGLCDVPDGVIDEDYAKKIAHGLVSLCFPQMPQGNLWEDAERLAGGFHQVKTGLQLKLNSPQFTDAEREAARDFKIDTVVELADDAFKKFRRSTSPQQDNRMLNPDASALYWLRMRSIGTAAIIVSREHEDPDF